jgi:hypothetical protein
MARLADHDVEGDVVRVADHQVRFGVSLDEGPRAAGRLVVREGRTGPAVGLRKGRCGRCSWQRRRCASRYRPGNAAHLARLLRDQHYPAS